MSLFMEVSGSLIDTSGPLYDDNDSHKFYLCTDNSVLF